MPKEEIEKYEEYICGDELTAILLKNYYQNEYDYKTFLQIDAKNKLFARTKNHLMNDKKVKLSSQIYFSPSRSPLLSYDNISEGSAWKDWYCPSFEHYYLYKNKKILVRKIRRRKISIEEYVKVLEKEIQKNLEKIYCNNNEDIILAYGRGIDSLTILSFIIKNKWQERTKLVCYQNTVTNQKKKDFSLENNIGVKVYDQFEFDIENLIDIINENSLNKLLCYNTYNFTKKYQGKKIVFGFHGNQTLLHKLVFLEQINEPVTINGYTLSCNDWKPRANQKSHSLMNYRLSYQKPWNELDEYHDSKIYDPLGSESIFKNLRCISWYGINPNYISQATVCRDIIKKNVGHMLDNLIGFENQNEGDVIIGDFLIDLSKIDQKIFKIKDDYRHDKNGLEWLSKKYNEAKKIGKIKLNTIISFININHLLK